MKRKRKAAGPAKPPRNPYARVLGTGPFKPKAVKREDAYVRRPRHRKPLKNEVEDG